QVRRDLMLISHSGTLQKGYDVKELINLLSKILDTDNDVNVAIIGLGNLGRAIMGYFAGKRPKLKIVAAFDVNPDKIDKVYAGVKCYHFDKITEIIKKESIEIGIITVPAEEAPKVAEKLVLAGIKGILNYSPCSISVSPNIYLEEYDMITSLEKVAYFVKHHAK
ncbi:MAG TPA: redox-sensing transcriptional repressor Rex, partial [Bacteroidales bacterium]|nr:redox-sensing transcriptional repressor Rex [Bacteroidales bacterium]